MRSHFIVSGSAEVRCTGHSHRDWASFAAQKATATRSRTVRGAIACALSIAALGASSGSAPAHATAAPVQTGTAQCNATQQGVRADECARSIANVRDYGATGNGVSSDTAAIQRAVDSDHAAIYFPAGHYLVDTCITIPSARHLYGDGAASKIIASKAFSACAPWSARGAAFGSGYFLLTNSDYPAGNTDIVVENLALDLSNKDVPGSHNIHFHHVGRTRINRVFTNGGNDGVAFTASTGFTVTHSKANCHSNAGLDTWEGSRDGLFIGNSVDGCGMPESYGILGTGITTDGRAATTARIRIVGNTIRNVSLAGIWIQGGVSGAQSGSVRDTEVIGNTIETVTGFHGIRTSESARITIAENRIANVRQVGILNQGENAAGASTQVVIRGNFIGNASAAGVGLYPAIELANGATLNRLSRNVVHGRNHTWGIEIDAGATRTVVQPNNMLQAGTRGLIVDNGGTRTDR